MGEPSKAEVIERPSKVTKKLIDANMEIYTKEYGAGYSIWLKAIYEVFAFLIYDTRDLWREYDDLYVRRFMTLADTRDD